MVTEQIANLSTGNRRLGSSPSLSALKSQRVLRWLFCWKSSGRVPALNWHDSRRIFQVKLHTE